MGEFIGMGFQFWLSIAVYIITGLVAVLRVGYIVGKMEAKCATKEELERAKAEGDEKRARIYKRFDEYKTHLESNFVRREMCTLMHNETAKAVAGLTATVKELTDEIHELKTMVIQLQANRVQQ